MSRYVRPSGDGPEYTDVLKAQVERLTAELDAEKEISAALTFDREQLRAELETERCLSFREQVATLEAQLTETRDLQRRVELVELKAQSGEPYGIVYEYHDYFGKHLSFRYYQRNGNYPAKSVKVYTHPTELPYNPLNDYAVIPMPTTERRVIPEELITRIKQTANRWANRSYDCGNRDGMGYQSSTPAKLMDQSRDDFNELIEELRNALNAAPKEMK